LPGEENRPYLYCIEGRESPALEKARDSLISKKFHSESLWKRNGGGNFRGIMINIFGKDFRKKDEIY